MYVILDGFDLGIGILFPFARSESERDQMMRSIAPFWDGNETWLVLGGGGLLVGVSARLRGDHAGVLSAGDRDAAGAGVPRHRLRIPHRVAQQDLAGTSPSPTGSTLAAFAQGVILGGLIQGVAVEDGAYAGGAFDWATPFALLCGLAMIAGYACSARPGW